MPRAEERVKVRVTTQELIDLMMARRGAKIETIITCTKPKLKRGHPFTDLLKVSIVNVVSGADYENSVNLQRGREGKAMDFEAQERRYGVHVENTPFVVHTPAGQTEERIYLPVHVRRSIEPPVYKDNGRTVPTEQVTPWLPSRESEGDRQEVDNPVVYRNYLLTNIIGLRYGGVEYEIIHRGPAQVQ